MAGHYNQCNTVNLYSALVKFRSEVKSTMSESNNLPQSISHKQLSYLLSNAVKDKYFSNEQSISNSKDKEELFSTLNEWEKLSKKLIKKVKSKNNKFLDQNSSSALMALGAFEAHINMALFALKEFKNNQEE